MTTIRFFVRKAFQSFLQSSGIASKKTAYRSPWQNPYVEIVIGTEKRELLDHVIPVSIPHNEYRKGSPGFFFAYFSRGGSKHVS